MNGILHRTSGLLASLYDDFKEFLSPSFCPGCGGDGIPGTAYPLCGQCYDRLIDSNRGDGPVCPFCSRPEGTEKQCHFCRKKERIRLFSWGPYDGLLKECITAFKFDGFPELGRPLIEMAVAVLRGRLGEYDVIIPVPLHKWRREERGFNQSQVLAQHLSEILKIDSDPDLLLRIKNTRQQAKLSENERWSNVKDAFAVLAEDRSLLGGKRVLLVDDIVTTGATIFEAARPLWSAGVAGIDVFALAYAR